MHGGERGLQVGSKGMMLEVAGGRRKTRAERRQSDNAMVLFNPAPVT